MGQPVLDFMPGWGRSTRKYYYSFEMVWDPMNQPRHALYIQLTRVVGELIHTAAYHGISISPDLEVHTTNIFFTIPPQEKPKCLRKIRSYHHLGAHPSWGSSRPCRIPARLGPHRSSSLLKNRCQCKMSHPKQSRPRMCQSKISGGQHQFLQD